MLYLIISEGATAASAEPIIASKDPAIVKIVADAIAKRLRPTSLSVVDRKKASPEPETERRE